MKENATEAKAATRAETLAALLKLSRKAFWDNQLKKGNPMPSILRGSKAHNAKVAAAKAAAEAAQALAALPTTIAPATLKELNKENAPSRVPPTSSAITSKETLLAKAADLLAKPSSLTSSLYCDEVLSLSPKKPAAPKRSMPPLSPFSQAKLRARYLGVGLGDDCRDVYTIEEIHERITYLANVTKRSQPR